MCTAVLLFDQEWLLAVIAYGFVARVLTGPTLSPLGQLVTRVVTPRLDRPAKLVPGPPKRFAQGMGAAVSVAAVALAFGFDKRTAANILVALMLVAATLESVFAYCIGCRIFALMIRAGFVPEGTCEKCNQLGS